MSASVAADLFLAAHDMNSGKLVLAEAPLGVSLAGGLLADLILSRCVVAQEGQLLVGERLKPPDEAARFLVDDLSMRVGAGWAPMRDWVIWYRASAFELVATRMLQAGLVTAQQHRRFGRTSVRYLPANPGEAFIRSQRISSYLRNGVELEPLDVLYAELALMVDGGGRQLGLSEADRPIIDREVERLPVEMRDLLAAVGPLANAVQSSSAEFRG